MPNLNSRLRPLDAIAALIIVGCFVIMLVNSGVDTTRILDVIVGFYFGKASK